MEGSKMDNLKTEEKTTGLDPKLAAIAQEALEQAAAKHVLSPERLAHIVARPEKIYNFFVGLIKGLEFQIVPTLSPYPDRQLFTIEALTGECKIIDYKKMTNPLYHKIDIEEDAANFLSGPSPPTKAVEVKLEVISGALSLEQILKLAAKNFEDIVFTKAQIRRFCVKYKDLMQGNNRRLLFLFRFNEKPPYRSGDFYGALANIDKNGLSIRICSLLNILKAEENWEICLVTPNRDEDDMMSSWLGEDPWHEG